MNRRCLVFFLIFVLLCVFIVGCTPAAKTIHITDLINSDDATKDAQAGLSNSAAANECTINCTVADDTWTYNYYYKTVTKSNLTNDTINAWEQYAGNMAKMAHDKFSSGDIHLTFTIVFNFYGSTNELLYNTSKPITT